MDIPPNNTIYINNLNEKIKKDPLRESLYHVFSQFGTILEIQASKVLRKRGQAWVVFDDLGSATKAVKEMQNFLFYGKPMRVQYAKVKSDVISKRDGTFVARPKRKQESESKMEVEEKKKTKKQKVRDTSSAMDTTDSSNNNEDSNSEPEQPNKILFLENLPEQCTDMMLSMLFQQYDGYQATRMVEGRPGIAFVEFVDSFQAGRAKDSLQGFKITADNSMKITYAKQ